MTESTNLAADLDSIVHRAPRSMRAWAWRQAAERGATALVPATVPIPCLVLAASVWSLFAGRSWWPFGAATTVTFAIAVPLACYLVATVLAYLRHPPSRAMALAFHDHHLGLRDRLQAADNFLHTEVRSAFAQAAIEDAACFARQALTAELPKLQWRLPALRVARWPVGALALAVLIAGLFLHGESVKPRSGSSTKISEIGEGNENPVAAMPLSENPDEDTARRDVRRPPPRLSPHAKRSFALAPDVGDERRPLGMGDSPGDFEPSERHPTNAQSSQAGLAAAGASSQGADQATRPPRERTRRSQGKRGKPTKIRHEENASSGVSGGGGSSAGSRLAASDHPAADNKVRGNERQADVADEAEDEDDEEQKAASTRKPMLSNQKAPVDRSMSPSGMGNQERDDLNSRSGPGGLKKTRGVAAMLLGVPMPDHLRGQPNPGRVKMQREHSAPEERAAHAVDAKPHGRRDAAFGDISHMRLPPRARNTVRDYFLAQRRTTINSPKEEP